jgi:hypothetical protein
MGNKMGRFLARKKFVRRAIEEKADLAAFRKPPTAGILLGIFLVSFSFLMSWPAISVLGGVAIYFRRPWIVVIGGPVLYGLSHLVFLGGMVLCGGVKYPYIFLRWAVRVGVERLLAGSAEGD